MGADHCLLFLSNEWSKGNRSQQRYRHRLLLLNLLWQKLRSLLLSFNGAANELELWNYILKSLLPSFFALFLKNYWIGGTFFFRKYWNQRIYLMNSCSLHDMWSNLAFWIYNYFHQYFSVEKEHKFLIGPIISDESEPTWLEPYLELKDHQLGSWLFLFS